MKSVVYSTASILLSLGLSTAWADNSGEFTDYKSCIQAMKQYASDAQNMAISQPDLTFSLLPYMQWFNVAAMTGRFQASQTQDCENGQCTTIYTFEALGPCDVLNLSIKYLNNHDFYDQGQLPEYVGNEIRYWTNFKGGNTSSHSYPSNQYNTYTMICKGTISASTCTVTPVL